MMRDPFEASYRADQQRHSDTMEVLKTFCEAGNAGSLDLHMDRYGDVTCKIVLTGKRGENITINEIKQKDGILALRARIGGS
jgi:hypothetical protein